RRPRPPPAQEGREQRAGLRPRRPAPVWGPLQGPVGGGLSGELSEPETALPRTRGKRGAGAAHHRPRGNAPSWTPDAPSVAAGQGRGPGNPPPTFCPAPIGDGYRPRICAPCQDIIHHPLAARPSPPS